MKMAGRQPRFLPDVMQAIVDLKDGNGSTQNRILEHIQNIINSRKINPKPRNISMQVKRALKHGLRNGLIKQRNGKFQLGIQPRDFALFKAFRYMEPLKDCTKCRKGRRGRRHKGKRRGRRRRKRGRRRKANKTFSESDLNSAKSDTSDPVGACKNERKKVRRGDSYARSSKASSGTDQRSRSHRSSKGSIPSQRGQRKYEDDRRDYQRDDEIDGENHDNYDSYVN